MASKPYANIKAELARNGVSQKAVAEHYGVTQNTVNNKINGRSQFTAEEIIDWRDTFMPDATLEYLLARD